MIINCNTVERYADAAGTLDMLLLPCIGLFLEQAKNTLPGPWISNIKDLPIPRECSWYDDKGLAAPPTPGARSLFAAMLLLLFKPLFSAFLNIEAHALI